MISEVGMFQFRTRQERLGVIRRKQALRALAPAMGSERLVHLFLAIATLAVTRPEAVKTIALLVGRLERPRAAKAALETADGLRIRGAS
jgi:hypothetical protein